MVELTANDLLPNGELPRRGPGRPRKVRPEPSTAVQAALKAFVASLGDVTEAKRAKIAVAQALAHKLDESLLNEDPRMAQAVAGISKELRELIDEIAGDDTDARDELIRALRGTPTPAEHR